ncbi:ApaG domain-containing protein [Tribonema minus]|uniref:ApaG domain-containing protein n=1 Tax=Tribonema minus TaxID=303371 RepID=A0A835ZBY5_9STRA|nr:ApaG domain-containing protein [Tribonema minus]
MTAADAHNNNAQRLPQAEPQPAPAVYLNGDEPIQLPEIVAPELSMTAEERVVLWEEICASEPRLQLAIEEQDFGTAEQLRNRITALKAQDPYFALREAIDSALAREDYYSAAKFKLQLDKLGPPQTILESVANGSRRVDMSPTINQAVSAAQQSAAAAAAADAQQSGGSGGGGGAAAASKTTTVYSTRSETETHGVRVEVRAQYFPEQSDPAKAQFVFVYRVRVTNASRATVQLAARRWHIRTANAKTGKTAVQEVKGPGVVGQQPVLEPGQSFEYSSACPVFQRPRDSVRVLARMEGAFTMVTGAVGERGFEAKIDPFYLILPESVV